MSPCAQAHFVSIIVFSTTCLLQPFTQVRRLALVSAIANASIICGFSSVLAIVLRGFANAEPFQAEMLNASWPFTIGYSFRFVYFLFVLLHVAPIYPHFCLSGSAFEGIGTIVAIESSMRSPRKHFPRLIAVAISSVLVILCGFGTACYGYFGAETKQVITLNLSDGSHLVVALWSFILVSILLTFPLQVFPIFLAVEDVWYLENRTLFLLRRAAITACCTGHLPLLLRHRRRCCCARRQRS